MDIKKKKPGAEINKSTTLMGDFNPLLLEM
jgi:hypothetical protein